MEARREAKFEEITLGEAVCITLRNIYHTDTPWPACYQQVADKFTELKKIMRKFYADKSDLEILKELVRYSQDDIKDAFAA
jgi:hypothetical protein